MAVRGSYGSVRGVMAMRGSFGVMALRGSYGIERELWYGSERELWQ